MTDGPRTERLVLDASAVAAWIRGSVAVGELIAEIDEEHGAVLLPLPCLVRAAHENGLLETGLLQILVEHPAVFVISDDPADWLALAAMNAIVDGADRASAALLALTAGVDILTRDASWYQGVSDGQIGLEFED
ncbi:hypothetical protein [Actinoplanes sp. L3-i22]|uniref:hypothetical protein n=1 Tax=Actinoplanes sp. L3-i22 TaxID=2836373 RepID=UPI001C78758C|nr:hypothetical protein [Actinoplanes sp. L3-i22]BCY09229.1 hypothetical protein L3i22_043170 [Actinoplanes sp. L3-i22]